MSRAPCWMLVLSAVSVALAGSAPAEVLRYELVEGSTLAFEGEASAPLMGSFDIECPPPPPFELDCGHQVGEVVFDVVALTLASGDLELAGEGPGYVLGWSGGGSTQLILGRRIELQDVGVLFSPPRPHDADVGYGFDAELIEATPLIERHRLWWLRNDPLGDTGWLDGILHPESFEMDLVLEEQTWDFGPTLIEGMTVERSAQLHVAAAFVPEPSATALRITALLALCARRRRTAPRSRAGARTRARRRTRRRRPESVLR